MFLNVAFVPNQFVIENTTFVSFIFPLAITAFPETCTETGTVLPLTTQL